MKFARKSDILLIAALAALAFGIWLAGQLTGGEAPLQAEIYYYDRLVETLDLVKGSERTFSIEENPQVIFRLDEEGTIAFVASDCPDQICVRTGRLHRKGQYAACLPNGIVLKIVSAQGGGAGPDLVIGGGSRGEVTP